jgi:hypothetical protein
MHSISFYSAKWPKMSVGFQGRCHISWLVACWSLDSKAINGHIQKFGIYKLVHVIKSIIICEHTMFAMSQLICQ